MGGSDKALVLGLIALGVIGAGLARVASSPPEASVDEKGRESGGSSASGFRLTGKHVEVHHGPGESARRAARALLARREAAARRMGSRRAAIGGGRARSPARVRFVLFPSLESKITLSGTTEEAGPDRRDAALVPIAETDPSEIEDLAHARALARSLFSKVGAHPPGLEWGLAVFLNGSWKGRPAADACARLAAAGVLPSVEEILAGPQPGARPVSPLFLGPAGGCLVEFAISRLGTEGLGAAIASADPARSLGSALASSLKPAPHESPGQAQEPAPSGRGSEKVLRAPGKMPGESTERDSGAASAEESGPPAIRGDGATDVGRGGGGSSAGAEIASETTETKGRTAAPGTAAASKTVAVDRWPSVNAEPAAMRAEHGHGSGTTEAEDMGAALESAWRAWLRPHQPPAARVVPREFQRGVCLAHTNSARGGYGSLGLQSTLDRLAALGVDWISITPFGFQGRTDSAEIGFVLRGAHAETDEVMRHVVRQAHRRGLKVLYKPHLWVGHRFWTGEISMANEAAWSAWFDSYRKFIVHHAVLAEEEEAEIFCVGAELVKTVHRDRDWRAIIGAVRSVYGGRITYAANWGEEVERAPFWDALDYVGVNAYYPLASEVSADDESLERGARAVRDRLAAIGKRSRRPVLLTEVGFAARPACWVDPHREDPRERSDPGCQARAYRAVLESFSREPFTGIYWWKFESDPTLGGPADSTFTPRGKPAEEVLGLFYQRWRAESTGGSGDR